MYNLNIKNALYNLSPNSGSTPEYAQGVLVGVVSALMDKNVRFSIALKNAVDNFPNVIMNNCIPPPWRDDVAKLRQ